MGVREGYFDAGMSLREYTAISLRIADSGNDAIDAMIRKANRQHYAGLAMQGICAGYQDRCAFDKNDADAWAEEALHIADALIARLEEDK